MMARIKMIGVLVAFCVGCAPRLEVAVSDKPITVNLNVKIEHEIRVKLDKELDQLFSEESGLF